MGECLITRRGGESYELPVLDANYPQDVNLTVIEGNTTSATFNVSIEVAGKPAEYTYQWYVNGSAVSGATNASYTKSDLSSSATYSVYCEVTNKAGVVTSRVATLKVDQYYTPTLNNSYPANTSKTYITGGTASASFSVIVATAGNPSNYTYQWYVNNSAVSGATGSTYNWSGTEGTYNIYCKVTNAAGSVDSRTATLSVTRYYTPTLNSSYPADTSKTYISGGTASATFEVQIATAGVPANYTYQWYLNNSAVSGATGSSYTWTGTEGTYSIYCKVENDAGSVNSRTATLSVTRYYTPTLNGSYPADVSVVQNSSASATFNVSISTAGSPNSYSYQWYVNNSAVSGATSSSYTRTGLTFTGTYSVYCKVTNDAGSVNSRTATLTVTSAKPSYTYTGSANLIDDGSYNYRIKFLTSGVITFTSLGSFANGIDVFCVGGGGGGGFCGGGGGYTKTGSFVPNVNTPYEIVIGAGDAGTKTSRSNHANSSHGGSTSAFGVTATGGGHGSDFDVSSPAGGNGGSGGGYGGSTSNGGSDGGNGSGGNPGIGQGRTTREFGQSGATLYAGGGGGGNYAAWGDWGGPGGAGGGGAGTQNCSNGLNGTANTGGGGGGGYAVGGGEGTNTYGGSGGSGIVVIRNKR